MKSNKKGFTTFMKTERGFTLIEILVVVSLLSVFGILILTIFTRTLRGGNKSAIIGMIKQNGQSVLESMDKVIRSSDDVICPIIDLVGSSQVVISKNGIYTRFRFIAPNPPSSNGSLMQDNPIKEKVLITNTEETDTEFINRVCDESYSLKNPVVLSDTNLQTGVSIEDGEITKTKTAGFKDQITIDFNVKPPLGIPSSVSGQIDSVNFKTTIQLR